MQNYYIDKILEEHKITTFLDRRGVYPVRESGDRLIYHCPIHSGDNDPSFMVYPEGADGRKYQTYYCFGCHAGINVINLKMDLDKLSSKESISSFLRNMKIDKGDAVDSIVNDILDDIQQGNLDIDDNKKVEPLLLLINTICRNHLSNYEDEEEILFFEEFFKKVDAIARAKDIGTLEQVKNMLIIGLVNRAAKFNKRREKEVMSSVEWDI